MRITAKLVAAVGTSRRKFHLTRQSCVCHYSHWNGVGVPGTLASWSMTQSSGAIAANATSRG